MAQAVLIQFAVAWTLVGAFIFTVAATCGSLIGWVKFADPSQQKKLVSVLCVELMTVGVTFFGGILNYSPAIAVTAVQSLTNYDYWRTFRHAGVPEIGKPSQFPDEYRYGSDGVDGSLKYYPSQNVYVESNRRENAPRYYYYFRPIRTEDEFLYVYDDSRGFALKLPLHSGMASFRGSDPNAPFTDFHSVVTVQ